MRRVRGLLALALLATAGRLLAQAAIPPSPGVGNPAATRTGPGISDGKAMFHEKCGMCHGPGGMGTGLLARRMDPAVAELEKRGDLMPDFVTAAARMGVGNMPAISRGEVSDRQMAAIAAYLAKGKAQ